MKIKSMLSVSLAIILLICSCLPAFAEGKYCSCGDDPVIIVNGMGYFPYVVDRGTPNEHQVFPPTQDALTGVIATAIPAVLKGMNGDWVQLERKLLPEVFYMFKEFSCNPDGSSRYNVSTTSFDDSMENYPDEIGGGSNEGGLIASGVEKLPEKHTYDYNYDWRISPLINAADLRELIEYAKQNSGHDKVDIVCCSMGGIQAMGYIYEYGTEDIDSITLLSSTFTGVPLVGDLFRGKVTAELDNVIPYLKMLAGEKGSDGTIQQLYDALKTLGAAGLTQDFVDDLLDRELSEVYRQVLIPVFGYMGGLWALCRDDSYEEAKEFMLDKATPSFIELIDEFHYNVLNKTEDILSKAREGGTKIYVSSHYNLSCVPLYESADMNGDNTLESTATAGFATYAKLGKTLTPDTPKAHEVVCANKSHNHFSPDGVVDASTCLFPEFTWFFRDVPHVNVRRGTKYEELVWTLIRSDIQLSIYSMKQFPQFMLGDDNNEIYPLFAYDDLDGDGKYTTDDARLALKAAGGTEKLEYNQLYAANYDGTTVVTVSDAQRILKKAIGIE